MMVPSAATIFPYRAVYGAISPSVPRMGRNTARATARAAVPLTRMMPMPPTPCGVAI